jgi:hypothetical protein
MKKDYNETKHLECRQHKINSGFKLEDYQQDVQKTLEYVYRLGYQLDEISTILDEVKNIINQTIEMRLNENINRV